VQADSPLFIAAYFKEQYFMRHFYWRQTAPPENTTHRTNFGAFAVLKFDSHVKRSAATHTIISLTFNTQQVSWFV
jgi:hypothetical protein